MQHPESSFSIELTIQEECKTLWQQCIAVAATGEHPAHIPNLLAPRQYTVPFQYNNTVPLAGFMSLRMPAHWPWLAWSCPDETPVYATDDPLDLNSET